MEQAEEDQVVYMSPIYLLKPFCPLDHVGPELIVKEEVQVYVPPPMVVDNCLVIQLPWLPNPMEGVLGNLQFLSAFPSKGNKEGNYLIS